MNEKPELLMCLKADPYYRTRFARADEKLTTLPNIDMKASLKTVISPWLCLISHLSALHQSLWEPKPPLKILTGRGEPWNFPCAEKRGLKPLSGQAASVGTVFFFGFVLFWCCRRWGHAL